MEKKQEKGLGFSAKSFITAIAVIFVLMILTYMLTFIIPGGYIPFGKWLLSPILVLGAEGNVSLIAVLAFLLIIGGVFNNLNKCGLTKYMLDQITYRFAKERYKLLVVVTLFFMEMGAFIGSFEECVPLVPIVVALAIRLGWDALVGIGMSLLAIGCGFASGICNPFTIGVAQELAGLPMFSGMWFRIVSFLFIFSGLILFLYRYAKKIETPLSEDILDCEFAEDLAMKRAMIAFVVIMLSGIAVVLSSVVIQELQDYTMIVVGVTFLAGGLTATILSMNDKHIAKTFLHGMLSVLPGVLMILMANSIKFTLEEGNILNPILDATIATAQVLPRWAVILFIYFVALFMNFFISSGSAKAFLLMPIILPIAEAFDISAQLCVVAYAFGDGFSNTFYPTNPVLLISLGIANIDYGTWAKWSGKFQFLNLILTSVLLLIGLVIGYA